MQLDRFQTKAAPESLGGISRLMNRTQVHAAAIQPADAKVAKLAILSIEYPGVLGSPVSGTVEALGAGVDKVKVGDRIVCGTKIFTHKKPKYGGHQRFTLVDESEVVVVCGTNLAARKKCADSSAPRLVTSTLQRLRH